MRLSSPTELAKGPFVASVPHCVQEDTSRHPRPVFQSSPNQSFLNGLPPATSIGSGQPFLNQERPMRKLSKATLFSVLIWTITIYLPLQIAAQTQAAHSANPSTPTKPRPKKSVVYVNKQYGFRFYLPKSWEGYSILVEKWEGSAVTDEAENKTPQPETGPEIIIRHPLWTDADPRQDIPIMIFTPAQWKLIENDQMNVSAAPIGPSELGHNAKYVFALPPRYNYALPTGYEEVDRILSGNSLRPF
jgi:hypothetical protein